METIGVGTIIIIAIAVVIGLLITFGVKVVPQGMNYVVQRLGKYNKTLTPGLNFIIPFIDDIAAKLTTKEIVLDIEGQEVITRDNAVIIANAVAFIQITSPHKAVYGIESFEIGIINLVQTTLRSIIGETDLDEALSSRDEIRAKLKQGIADNITDWGITLKNVEIQDIRPSRTMQDAMEKQAAAERQRRAVVTQAEGEKAAAILEADGRLEASRRDAEAKVVLAKADQQAISSVTEAIKDNDLPAMFLMATRYVQSLEKMGLSENAKTILLPADLPAAVRGLMGTQK